MKKIQDTITESEVKVALMIEKSIKNTPIVYRELKKRSLRCRLFHKQHIVNAATTSNKIYYCCHNCSCVWTVHPKKR